MSVRQPEPAPAPPHLLPRRLFLVRSTDGAHACLVPVQHPPAAAVTKDRPGFTCACGTVFDGVAEMISWTSEYEPRCLNRMGLVTDNRRTS